MRIIDADKLKAHYAWWEGGTFEMTMDEAKSDFDTIIDLQPTVEAEPIKHGRWKPFDLTWGRSVYACTNCGEAFEVPTEDGKPIYDYCPNCGAKMDGGENGDML